MKAPEPLLPIVYSMETPHGMRWAFRRNGIDYGDWLRFTSYEACRAVAFKSQVNHV